MRTTLIILFMAIILPAAAGAECINNCFVFEAYHDEMDPEFKPFRITMDSVGVRRVVVYRRSASEDLDYYMDKVPKVIRDIAPNRAMRMAIELQNRDRGIYPSQEEQATNRLNDKLNAIKTNQFLMNQQLNDAISQQQYRQQTDQMQQGLKAIEMQRRTNLGF